MATPDPLDVIVLRLAQARMDAPLLTRPVVLDPRDAVALCRVVAAARELRRLELAESERNADTMAHDHAYMAAARAVDKALEALEEASK